MNFEEKIIERLKRLEREVERLRVKESPGAWQSWTPTWTASTTNPAIGNGTLKGRYCKVGKMVTFSISLMFGSTTTAGLGDWAFSLPAGSNTSSIRYIGVCTYWDASPAGGGSGATMLQEGDTQLNRFYVGGYYRLDSVKPITWANLDQLYLTMTYEVE